MRSSLFSVPKTGPTAGRLTWTRGAGITQFHLMRMEDLIATFERGSAKWNQGTNLLIRTLALMTVSEAVQKSYGMNFDRQNPARGAWMIPVRRISGDYVKSWKVKKRGNARWLVYNDSREAYFIEYGIHTSPFAVKRPVLKMSAKKTIDFTRGTKTFERFVDSTLFQPGFGLPDMSQMLHRHPTGSFRTYSL